TRAMGAFQPRVQCAQRLSASSSASPVRRGDESITCQVCSTPLGVIVGFTSNSTILETRPFGCSTPVGVIVRFTHRAVPEVQGADLLNASRCHRRLHPYPESVSFRYSTCSTPLGVIVGFTGPEIPT